jgi:chromosome segregation ATPase
MSKHDADTVLLQTDTDKINYKLQNNLNKDIQDVNKPRKVIKKIKHPENDKTLKQQIQDDKYIELNDKMGRTVRDELLKGKTITDASSYPLTLNDNVDNSYKQLKKNMNNIMTNPGSIESIVNSFSVEQIKNLNTNWESIQKKYINKYGFNNPNLTNNEIKEFLLSELSQSKTVVNNNSDILKKMKEESNKVDDNVKKITEELSLMRRTIDGLHRNKNISLLEYQRRRDKIIELSKKVNNLTDVNKELVDNIDNLEQNKIQLEEKLDNLEIKNQIMDNEVNFLKELNKRKEDVLKGTKSENEELKKELVNIQNLYGEVMQQNNNLNEEYNSLNTSQEAISEKSNEDMKMIPINQDDNQNDDQNIVKCFK